jgi:glycolate dehydrogenase FAD-binding subunit
MSTAAIPLEQARAQLATIAGDEHACLAADAVAVAPGSAAEIAEILRYAQENRLPVTPSGGGTKLHWGNPVAAGIQLSLRRLQSVQEHSWQDMTCTVDAGCTWSALQRSLAQHEQMVALDPLWPERATVGGIVASNDSGALRHRYGSLRDLVLGMTLVLADGTIAKTGGKVVKNVAGYDLHKLLIGSYGTLGVITQVNFRLHPIEKSAQTWTVEARDAESLRTPLHALLDAHLTLSAVQIRADAQGCGLDVRLAARPECLGESADRLQKLCGGFAVAQSGEDVWEARQGLFDRPAQIVLKVSTLPSEVCALLDWLREQDAAVAAVAQANGLITAALHEEHAEAQKLLQSLRARVRLHGGSMVVLQMPDELRASLDVWGCESNALTLMREIKQRFDPCRILNPGRFVENL